MKKKFNWLGWIFISLYILILIVLIVFCFYASGAIKAYLYFGVLIFGVSFVWLIPTTYLITLRFILPLEQSLATVYIKHIKTIESYTPADGYSDDLIPYIDFLLDDGTRKTCRMTAKKYRLLSSGDRGILYYKEQGKRTFFIDFKKL